MPLDPLMAFALMLIFWTFVIAYTLRMADIEQRRPPPCPPVSPRPLA